MFTEQLLVMLCSCGKQWLGDGLRWDNNAEYREAIRIVLSGVDSF